MTGFVLTVRYLERTEYEYLIGRSLIYGRIISAVSAVSLTEASGHRMIPVSAQPIKVERPAEGCGQTVIGSYPQLDTIGDYRDERYDPVSARSYPVI